MTIPQTVAIEQLEEALEDGHLDHASRSSLLFRLAKAFHIRFYDLNAIMDIEAAIKNYHEAIECLGDANRESPTLGLANAYVDKHQATQETEDLVQSIEHAENALQLISKSHDVRCKLQQFLGDAYTIRYKQTAQIADLNLAIQNTQAVLSSVTEKGENPTFILEALCQLHYTKCFEVDLSDLDAAIENLQGLLQIMRDSGGKENMSLYHDLLGDLHDLKYSASKSSKDLHNLIQSRRISVAMSHDDDPKRGLRHYCLASLLLKAFKEERKVAYLEESVSNFLSKLSLTPETSPSRLQQLSDIAIVYSEIHYATCQIEPLDKCHDIVKQALGMIHASHPNYEDLFKILHDGHLIKYALRGSRDDFESWLRGPCFSTCLHDQGIRGLPVEATNGESLTRWVEVQIEDTDMFALEAASDHGHNDYVGQVLERLHEIDSRSPEFSRAVARAALRSHTDTIQLLLEAASNLQQNVHVLSLAIQDVATTSYTSTAEVLIQYGANIEARKAETGETPLHIASRYGQIDMVRLLLKKGADVNAVVDKVETAFYIASARANLELARLLHKQGADICIGYPLHVVVHAGHRDLAELLVSWGADVNSRDECDNPPLIVAARHGHTEIACILLDNGADFNATVKGYTSLYLSVHFQHRETVQLLLARGIDAKKGNRQGETPLHAAAGNGNVYIMMALMQNGCDLSQRDAVGRTPLHRACVSGHKAAVMELLGHERLGIDAVDRFGSTPLSMAARHGHSSVVEHLLELEVALDKKDCLGRTALWWARRESHTEAADSILQSTRLRGILEEDNGETTPNPIKRDTTQDGPSPQVCDVCTLPIRGEMYWHCSLCNSGDFDICPKCVEAGAHCFVTTHGLTRSTARPK